MKVILHAGAHHTDSDRLLKCLLKNKQEFFRNGIAVPGPGKYRTLIKESFIALDSAAPADDARDVIVDAILDEEKADRLILSNTHFFGSPRFALGDGKLYPLATRRLRQAQQLFAGDSLELFLAICNPATFLPNVMSNASKRQQQDLLLNNPAREIRWSDMLTQVRSILPDLQVTVWCYEDSPFIWSNILKSFAGLTTAKNLKGRFDLLDDIMSEAGLKRLRAYLSSKPELSDRQITKVIAAFLEKYAIPEAIEEELDLPGWTDELVDELTFLYDHDVSKIAQIDGIRFLAP